MLEAMRGGTLRTIFLDHWDDFFKQTSNKPRQDIIETVIKMLVCRTAFLGYQLYVCNACDRLKAVYHTCKSRFCSSCGKKATDNWIAKHLKLLPRTRYQHVTFTLPKELQPILWLNRYLINALMPLPARILTEHARRVGVIPGIFAALHTSGRDLKRNIHFHLSTTLSGLSPSSGKWIPYMRFNRRMLATIKTQWRDEVLTILQQAYENGQLILPRDFNHNEFTPCSSFTNWLNQNATKPWVVHFSKPTNNHKHIVEYLGKYLKKPIIGETRIKAYNGTTVTYDYYDHHEDKTVTLTMPVFDFIKRVITHIPDKYFKMVRYYNWLSTRTRNQYLPMIYEKLQQVVEKVRSLSWRDLFIRNFGKDPLQCPCEKKGRFVLQDAFYAYSTKQLLLMHHIVTNPKNY